MKHRVRRLALFSATCIPLLGFAFGGWAVATIDDVPTHLVAGQKTPISFVVRQHGVTLLSNLSPTVELTSGSTQVTVPATAIAGAGHYSATIVPPSPGMWTLTVHSGWGRSETTLLPLRAIAANAPAPRAMADVERGRQLFYGKGCVSCHVRGVDGDPEMQVGPALTGRRYPPEYVAKFLDDPEASPLSKANPNKNARMPKLGLNEREIAALVVFLNTAESAQRQ
jgi:mono/diheme cytochrome c family protein